LDCSIVIVVGAPVRLAAKLHIVAFVVSPDRRLELYTKQRLGAFGESARGDGVIPPSEATVFHPGDRNPLVRFGDNLAAVAVCADIGEPSHPRRAAERGATSYLVAEGGPPGATGSGRVRCRRRNRDDTRLADTDGQASLIHLTHPDAVVAAIRDVVR
jgi:predicted amidohydrolase